MKRVGFLLCWLVVHTVFLILLGRWAPRLVYPALVPFSVLVAATLALTVERHRGSWWRAAGHLAPQVVLVGWIVAVSPVMLGPEPALARGRTMNNAVLRDFCEKLLEIEGPAVVRGAMPHYPDSTVANFTKDGRWRRRPQRPGLVARWWIPAILEDRTVTLDGFVFFQLDPLAPRSTLEYALVDGRPSVMLPSDDVNVHFNGVQRTETDQIDGRRILRLDAAGRFGTEVLLYFHDGTGGSLTPITLLDSRTGDRPDLPRRRPRPRRPRGEKTSRPAGEP